MANGGGPSPENKVASAYIEVQTTGVPQVQADLQKVKDTADKVAGSQVDGQQKVAAATAKTTGTFADLRAKLNDSVPVAQNLVTTLNDVKGVAEMFFSIGKAIGDMVANVAALQYEAERIKLQGLQADARGQANLQNGPYGNTEAMKAAGVDPRGMSDLDAQIAQQEQLVRKLAAVRAFTTSDENPVGSLLSNLVQTATFGKAFSNDPSSPDFVPTFGEEKDAFNNFDSEQAKLNNLRNFRSSFAPRIRGGVSNLRAANVEAQTTPAAIGALTSTPMIGEDAMRNLARALDENTKAINEQRNQPR